MTQRAQRRAWAQPMAQVMARRRWQRGGLLLLLTMMLALSVLGAAAEPQQPMETVSGRLVQVIGEQLPTAEDEHEHEHEHADEHGEAAGHSHEHRVRWGVLGDDSMVWLAGQPRIDASLRNQEVTIEGTRLADGTLFPTSIIAPEADASMAVQPEYAPAIGVSRWVNIMCRFGDLSGEPMTPAQLQGQFSDTYPAMGNYFSDVSYGAMDLQVTTAPNWVQLPFPRSHYVVQDEWGIWFNQYEALNDCTTAADGLVDYSQFDGITMAFNSDFDGFAYGGEWPLTLDGVERNFGITWLPPFGYEAHNVLAHEIGHALGLPHSSGMYGQVYDSMWDLMSGGGTCAPYTPDWICVGVHPIAAYKHMLGWIPEARMTTVEANTSATMTLAPLSEPNVNGQLMAMIPINGSDTEFFSVEVRSFGGYDIGVPHEGVLIHRVSDFINSMQPAQVVDVDNNGNPNDYGALWEVGETFVDPGSGISVSVTGQTGKAYTIEVTSNTAFSRTWERTDKPVAAGAVSRTWMWGPEALTAPMREEYWDTPGAERTVVYWDKSRMEITDPSADPTSVWYVTNGLLARELITGELQISDSAFEEYNPSTANVAGDQDDLTGPAYATFGSLLSAPALADDAALIQRVSRNGVVTTDPALASYGATAAHRVTVPGLDHQVASPFWAFMNSTGVVWQDGQFVEDDFFIDPFYATGLPITEAYWATVKVAGESTDVLMQCFERRCLTWTPDNPEGWQVEAGNVGAHYYAWRQEVRPNEVDD